MSEPKNNPSIGDNVIPISKLHLNLSNPRHEPAESEEQAIARLCISEQIVELARDIVQRGALSPLEVFGVIPMPGNPGHYISVEGNRRTCALIVLNDPKRAPEGIQSQLRGLASRAILPKTVRAHVFSDEAQAQQWIQLRHLGGQGGAGTKDWDPTQQYRAAGGNAKSKAHANTLSVNVLDRLVARGALSPDERKKVNLTTLTRYLGTPGVRAIIGLGSNRDIVYTHDVDEVDATLLHLVNDSLKPQQDGSFRVNSRTDSTERINYANELKAKGVAPVSHLPQPQAAPAPSPLRPVSENSTPAAKKRSAVHPELRKQLVPSSFTVTLKDPVLLRLRKEALELELKTFSFCGNYLLRAIVEHILTLYAKKKNVYREGMTDAALTHACALQLKSAGVSGKALTNIEKAAGSVNSGHSLHSLGHTVHGGTFPTETDLKRHFDTWRPSLEAMLAALA
ncbi:hypothetical protein ACIGEO_18540 [Stenotrophomonas bentonitica]|uniref:hypothetical protein n=1 Tax=Stenotrophomonas bentonitica TaxID=1450134 RepID=UPI0037D85F16